MEEKIKKKAGKEVSLSGVWSQRSKESVQNDNTNKR